MLPGKKYLPADIAAIVWRAKWLLLIPVCVCSAAAGAVALKLPDRYRSEALIVVMPQRVPENYVRSTVSTRIEERLPALRQQVTSRTKLEAIIREFNLYPELRQRLPLEDVVERMRRDIETPVVRGDAFRVAYLAPDAQTAQRVAERLAGLFNELNLQDRALQADSTLSFLESQLDDARHHLEAQEAKLAAYKRSHPGEMPTERDSNLQVLNSLQMQLQNLMVSANRDRDRRLFLEQQIRDLEIEAATPLVVPVTSPDADLAAAPLAVQLEQAKGQLSALELRFKPDHPDVVRKKREIVEIEAKLRAEALERPPAGTPPPQRPPTPEELQRRARLRDMRSELSAIQIRLESSQATERQIQSDISSYQAKLAAVPTRESELAVLTRDYATLQQNYQGMLQRYQDAQVAADLERRQIGEQFRIVDLPRLPEKPFSPNRLLIVAAGAMFGLLTGLGGIGARVFLDRSVHSERDVITTFALPVLAIVPVLKTTADRRRQRRRRRLIRSAAVIVGIAVVLALYLVAVPGSAQ
ncbi:MAG: hypothetical protein KBA95_03845 [Acidobacteria bacterium]|nr:hypothetical protein [Acidobacteriota bacterium]